MAITDTQKRILEIAEKEFMTYGFQKASLRNIAKSVGLTTGAVYGYYHDKEALFSALVSKPADELMAKFNGMLKSYEMLAGDEKISMADEYMLKGISFFCEYIYEHRNAFYLIACCSEGTKYHSYIDDLAFIEEKMTHKHIDYLMAEGKISRKIDDMLIHMLIGSSFNSVFEVAVHDMTREKVKEYAKDLAEFYVAGWNKILG